MQEFLFDGEVLHELGGEFHKVPIYIGSTQASVGGIGKHTVQAVSELVQEGFHLTEGQQGRLVLCRFGEVHHNGYVGTAVLAGLFVNPLFLVAGHPGSRALACSGVEVGIEHGKEFPVFVEDFVGIHILVINGNIRILLEGDAIQSGCQAEYTFLHVVQLKVRAEQLIVDIELPVLQFMGIVRPVPRHQDEVFSFRLACQGLHFCIFLFGGGRVSLQQLVQQLIHGLTVLCHALLEVVFGEVVIA